MSMKLVKTLDEIKAMFDERSRWDFGSIADGMVDYSCKSGDVWYSFWFSPKMDEGQLDVTLVTPMAFTWLIDSVDPNQYFSLDIVNKEVNQNQTPDEIWEDYLNRLDNPSTD